MYSPESFEILYYYKIYLPLGFIKVNHITGHKAACFLSMNSNDGLRRTCNGPRVLVPFHGPIVFHQHMDLHSFFSRDLSLGLRRLEINYSTCWSDNVFVDGETVETCLEVCQSSVKLVETANFVGTHYAEILKNSTKPSSN